MINDTGIMSKRLMHVSDWRSVEVWTVEEAALLWGGLDPFEQNEEKNINERQQKKIRVLRKAIVESICAGTLPFIEAWQIADEKDDDKCGLVDFPYLPSSDLLITSKTKISQASFLKWANNKRLVNLCEESINFE